MWGSPSEKPSLCNEFTFSLSISVCNVRHHCPTWAHSQIPHAVLGTNSVIGWIVWHWSFIVPFGNTWTGLNVVRSRLKKGTKIIHDKCRNSEQRISLKVACTSLQFTEVYNQWCPVNYNTTINIVNFRHLWLCVSLLNILLCRVPQITANIPFKNRINGWKLPWFNLMLKLLVTIAPSSTWQVKHYTDTILLVRLDDSLVWMHRLWHIKGKKKTHKHIARSEDFWFLLQHADSRLRI